MTYDSTKEKVVLSDEQYINLFGEFASLFHQALFVQNSVALTDREKFTHYSIGISDMVTGLEGKPFSDKGNIPLVLRTGEQSIGRIPKEIYGVEFKSSTVPIRNTTGNIIGTLTVALSMDSQNALKEVMEGLSSSTEELSATSEEIASSSSVLSENIADIVKQTTDITGLIEKTNTILGFINQTANTSRILGLNASIEAARAGENGKGFAVVANEIRKMAENSAKAVVDTKQILSSIQEKIKVLLNKTQEISNISLAQASATQEISATVQSLAGDTEVIKTIAEII